MFRRKTNELLIKDPSLLSEREGPLRITRAAIRSLNPMP